MRLMDCFAAAIVSTIKYIDKINKGENPAYEDVRLTIERQLSEHSMNYLKGKYSEEQYLSAKFAVVAFIDESFLSSSWEHKKQWKGELLQLQAFQTVKAGKEFFNRLNSLSPVNPAERDIREVFYYCLILGFRGKYFNQDDQAKLDEIIKSNINLMVGGGETLAKFENEPFFHKGFIPSKKEIDLIHYFNYKPIIYGLPIAILLIVFFLLKLQIIEAADLLVKSI